ncbi:MAG TPA: HAD hydrolase family protein [Polyangiaceae bacterium]|nr:HAD hydrolase family protein [Polyangiaceae bacterium]
MKPLSQLDVAEARRLRGLLFDLDDTLLSHGVLTRAAYDALWSLRDAGLALVAVTGRPSSWGELVARQWPVDGCVTENGAVHLVRRGRAVVRIDACDEETRRLRRARLDALVARVKEVVPEARLTDDASGRVSDVTWDVGEMVTLPDERVRVIAREISAAGASSTQSSVHLHATFDHDDKATGSVRFCARELAEEPGSAVVRFAFIGDSGNDAACFAAFRTTFGVANVRSSAGALSVTPRYVATRAMGDGFAEVADALLSRRTASPQVAGASPGSPGIDAGAATK